MDKTDVEAVNRALEQIPSYPRLNLVEGEHQLQQEQLMSVEGWPLVTGLIAHSFARLLTEQDVRRLKICANDDCRWVFFDESKNRARQWCDTRLCGNLLKVRSFRARQKERR